MTPIEFSQKPEPFSVTYTSPSRDFSNIRDELNNDAINISKDNGPVYIAYSGGIDSQLIVRSFKDMNLDCEYVFLYCPGYNELDYKQVQYSASILGIDVKVITVNLDEKRQEWELENLTNDVTYISQYPFRYMCELLPENFPIITQGKNEPCVVGPSSDKSYIYHNRFEAMELRFDLMGANRKVIDFPYSSESIASYYTDKNMKTFVRTLKYYHDNSLQVSPGQMFNTYAKPFVKGQYYKENELVWYTKLTGYEDFPSWIKKLDYVREASVTVPYWDVVDFLENTRNEKKTFKEFNK